MYRASLFAPLSESDTGLIIALLIACSAIVIIYAVGKICNTIVRLRQSEYEDEAKDTGETDDRLPAS